MGDDIDPLDGGRESIPQYPPAASAPAMPTQYMAAPGQVIQVPVSAADSYAGTVPSAYASQPGPMAYVPSEATAYTAPPGQSTYAVPSTQSMPMRPMATIRPLPAYQVCFPIFLNPPPSLHIDSSMLCFPNPCFLCPCNAHGSFA